MRRIWEASVGALDFPPFVQFAGNHCFNDWGGRVCNIFFPVLGGNGTKIAPTGDRFDQPPGQMR